MAKLIKNYIDEICKRIKGKDVIDIGCCASSSEHLLERHLAYRKSAKSIVGIDNNRDLIKEAQKRFNYTIYYCDFTSIEDVQNIIDKFGKFDTIISTDVIEHIGNLTNFLNNIYRIMTNQDAILHLTTPNMRSPRWIYKAINGHFQVNYDHVCWLDAFVLKILLKRSDLIIIDEMYSGQENEAIHALGLQAEDWMAQRLYVTIRKGLKNEY